ncbi:MAG: hypothetical protein ACLS3C_01400 [Oscillospiraceae bacterium]
MAVTRYFLGGNTASGFVSFYGQFCRGPEDFLWVIKGGPGCGKSSFMKTIGKAAENAGLDVEYVLCSGDPDSVDGVYLPALHTGYADGTAPHVLEAVTPGAAGLYLDLGQFYDRIALQKERRAIELLQTRYRALYREAYARLVIHARPSCPLPAQEERSRRFLRAITCRGLFLPSRPQARCSWCPGRSWRRFARGKLRFYIRTLCSRTRRRPCICRTRSAITVDRIPRCPICRT